MNKVQIIGRTTKDIQLSYTQNQKAVGRFTVAVNRMKKEDGADFINCKVWGNRAEVMSKYIKKGHRVGISGRLETGSYEKDGHKVYTTEVVVDDFDFLEPKSDQTQEQPQTNDFVSVPDDLDSELPF